jgi:hypothetical protein
MLGGLSHIGQRVANGNDLLALAQDGFPIQAHSNFIASISPHIPSELLEWISSILPADKDYDLGYRLTVEGSMQLLSVACILSLADIATGDIAGACNYTFLPHRELSGRCPFEIALVDGDLCLAISPMVRGLNGLPV